MIVRLPIGHWPNAQGLAPRQFMCGYCGHRVASDKGFFFQQQSNNQIVAFLFICPNCYSPSFFTADGQQIPGIPLGRPVESLPDEIRLHYEEARNTATVGGYTAAVLLLRKLLMHISVNQGAPEGQSFVAYVEYLADHGFVPPQGKAWVDHIRTKGNEANHEIVFMSREDAETLMTFSEMLLRFLYEFPARIPKPAKPNP
jgi:hypothetical protein